MAQSDISNGHVHVHNLFLWSVAVIYLFAFASLYHQQPGLYGDHGILPVSRDIVKTPPLDPVRLTRFFLESKPTLLWVTQALKIDVQTGMDILALSGIALASFAIITRFARNSLVFGALWLLYLSLHSVGNVFMWFQWDALLLEAGFIAFIFAPIPLLMSGEVHAKLASISMWPVRWLLFRVMFMSGILKLQSGCPTWWKLTAMNHYYETQGLPTFLAWFCHQLPQWFGSLTLVHALFCEIILPWLYFAPTRGLRKFAFYNLIILELGIIITGNFCFHNLLLIVLGLSLLDDDDLGCRTYPRSFNRCLSLLSSLLNMAVVTGLLVVTAWLSGMQYNEKSILKFKPVFTETDLNRTLNSAWPASVIVALTSLSWLLLTTMWKGDSRGGALAKLFRAIFFGFYMFAALGLFGLSLSPYSTLTKSSVLGPAAVRIRDAHRAVEKFSIVNGYGLFRRMTGIGGRQEIILEGSNKIDSDWKEYEFLYKPGPVDQPPPFVVPHQPRIDWQMWFAALGDQRNSQWIHNLIYRLLEGQPEVLRLILEPTSSFAKKPPKYIRARLYKYWFTKQGIVTSGSNATTDWWRRKFDREWSAPVSLSDETFMNTIRTQGLGDVPKTNKAGFKDLRAWLKWTRSHAETLSAPLFIWSLFMVNIFFHRTLKALHL